MRALCLAVAMAVSASPAWANARITVLMDVLQIADVVEIIQAEGFAQAELLNEDMLDGRGGAFWQSQVRQIYDADKISETIRQALSTGLEPDEVEAVIAFYASPEARRIVEMENAARRAIADPEIEQAAHETFMAMAEEGARTIDLVNQFIDDNDLKGRNLSGTMSAHIQFYKGLSDGRYLEQTEAEILSQVWSQQDEIREETEKWLNSFLLMAYQPLPIETLEAHVAFSASTAGQALNASLFDGFERVNLDISYALGRAIALNADGDEI